MKSEEQYSAATRICNEVTVIPLNTRRKPQLELPRRSSTITKQIHEIHAWCRVWSEFSKI